MIDLTNFENLSNLKYQGDEITIETFVVFGNYKSLQARDYFKAATAFAILLIASLNFISEAA